MKTNILFFIFFIPLLSLSQSAENKALITLDDKVAKSLADDFFESNQIQILQYYDNLRIYLVGTDDYPYLSFLCKKSGMFSIVEKDFEQNVNMDYIPNDPNFGQQWHLRQNSDRDIDADEAWDLLSVSQTVTVAMMDGGLQVNHPDLIGNVDMPFNAVTNLPSNGEFVNDLDRHGTACSGVIAAVTNNGIGISSAGNNRVKVMPINIMSNTNGSSFSTTTSIQVNAINAAMSNPNCVAIAMSYSSSNYSQTLESAFQTAATQGRSGKGLFLCASTGNNNNGSATNYPANYSSVYGIGATTSTDLRANYSNFGNIVDISAPGSGIVTTDRLGSLGYNSTDYATVNGTSFSCPLAATCGALIIYRNPQLSNQEVMSVLAQTAEKVGGYTYGFNSSYPFSTRCIELGYGRINLKNALTLAGVGTPPPPPTPKHNITVQNCSISDSSPEVNQQVTLSLLHSTNSPNLTSVESVIQVAISNDIVWSIDDIVIGADTAILGSGVGSVQHTFAFAPSSFGIKYVLIKSDALNAIDEYVETDNSCTVQYEVLPPVMPIDLQVIITSANWTGCSNTPQPQLRYRFKNVGTTSITSWTWRTFWQNGVPSGTSNNFTSNLIAPQPLAPGQMSSEVVHGFNYTSFPEGTTINRCVEILTVNPGPDQQTLNNIACTSFTRACLSSSNDSVIDEQPTYSIYSISGMLLDYDDIDELPHGIYIVKAEYQDRTETFKVAK